MQGIEDEGSSARGECRVERIEPLFVLVLSAGSFHRAVHTFFELLEHFLLRLIRFVSLLFSPLITLLPAISQKEMMAVLAMIAH